jgi:cysteine desulfurase family protein (TIGR01976 family)
MAQAKKWDIDFVRHQFPALADDTVGQTAFFENAGGTYVPHQVIEHLNHFMVKTKVQPYGPYSSSQRGTEAIEQATIKMAEMINADEDEVVIGHCTTMNLYMLSMSLRQQFKQGDEIIVTEQDHESNISPWLRLQEFGVTVKFWPIDSQTGELQLAQLDTLLSERTRMVCVTHSSNIVGDVNPIKVIADKVHAVNGWILVDGVSYAPHHAIDVKNLGVDVYVLSLYKLFGPHLGLMYVGRELHDLLSNQSLQYLPALYKKFEHAGSPNKLRIATNPGMVNHEETACLLGLVDYFETLYEHHQLGKENSFHEQVKQVMQLAEQHETQLAKQFQSWVASQTSIKLVGSTIADVSQRSPTWSLRCNNHQPRDIAMQLAERNIAVQSGGFYAFRCVEKLGIDADEGVLRISLAHFNTEQEMAYLCQSLEEII